MKHSACLFEEITQYKDYLSTQGAPQIDYQIRYDQVTKEDIINLIKNFEKSLLWRQGKLDEIENFDELYGDKIQRQCDLNDIRRLTIQSKMQTMMAQKSMEFRHSRAQEIFKRTIKRLIKIYRFANISG